MASIVESVKKLSRQRAKTIDQLTQEMYDLIKKGQDDLYKDILRQYLMKELSVFEDGRLRNIQGNYASTVNLDRIWKKGFQSAVGEKMVKAIIDGTRQLTKVNTTYFNLFDAKTVKAISKQIQNKILSGYGITAEGELRPESFLNNIIKSTEPINKLKGLIHQAVATETKISALEQTMKVAVVDEGLVKRYLDNSQVTNIYDRYDRQTSNEYADALQLDYAIYQGGLIEDSRPFCIERNAKVFTREEILKFGTPQDKYGGYSNKSAGEFQGKFRAGLKVYDPLTDMGCYNCRHHWDWISYEMASLLRPDLKKKKP